MMMIIMMMMIIIINNNNNKGDVERLYIPRKDGGRGLIDVETAFKTVTTGINHYLRHKEGQHPKQVLEH